MWVGVCCECQQGGKPLRWHPSGGYVIDYHESFGSSCEGEGTAPQATYQAASGSDQMPSGIQVVNGNDLSIGNDLDYFGDPGSFDRAREEQRAFEDAHNAKHGYSLLDCPDDFDRKEQEREQAKEAEKQVCCADKFCNHRPDPSKPAGMFGTIGDLLLAAKNGNKGKAKKRG